MDRSLAVAISFSSLPGVAHAVCLERGLGIGLGKIRSVVGSLGFPVLSPVRTRKDLPATAL